MNTTKTAQFTPGPWHLSECATQTTKAGICSANGLHITDVNGYGMTDVQNQANATLITAAPAMYEALKALHSVLDQRMPDGRTLNQHLSQEVFECFYGPAIAARAAIAKAEGA